jgi:hypothetical protein
MGRVAGDKGMYHRKRRKKLVRREAARALRAEWAAGTKPEAKAAKPKAAPKPKAAEPAAAEPAPAE